MRIAPATSLTPEQRATGKVYIQFGSDGPCMTIAEAVRQAASLAKKMDIADLAESLEEWRQKEARQKRADSALARGPAKAAARRVAEATRRDVETFEKWQQRARATLVVRGRPLADEARLRAYRCSERPSARRLGRLKTLLSAGKLPPLK